MLLRSQQRFFGQMFCLKWNKSRACLQDDARWTPTKVFLKLISESEATCHVIVMFALDNIEKCRYGPQSFTHWNLEARDVWSSAGCGRNGHCTTFPVNISKWSEVAAKIAPRNFLVPNELWTQTQMKATNLSDKIYDEDQNVAGIRLKTLVWVRWLGYRFQDEVQMCQERPKKVYMVTPRAKRYEK